MIPLELTSKQQTVLANTCSVMRSLAYKYQTGQEIDAQKFVDELCDIVDRFNIDPQYFDVLYDRLHRSGSNS